MFKYHCLNPIAEVGLENFTENYAPVSNAEDADAASFLDYDYAQWKDIRPVCFDLIKGKRTPTKFTFVLYLKPEALSAMFEKAGISQQDSLVQNLILNIRFEQGEMSITTGVDYSGFTLDKQAEQLWDSTTRKFLDKKEIAYI